MNRLPSWILTIALLAAAGCSFDRQTLEPPGTTCSWDYAPVHFDPCRIDEAALRPLALDDARAFVVDTTALTVSDAQGGGVIADLQVVVDAQPDGLALAILLTGDFALTNGASLRAIGSRPLVIAAFGTLAIGSGSTLDVSSTKNGFGAGAVSTADSLCAVNGAGDGMAQSNGGSGGGGGGFGGVGGGGGAGADSQSIGGAGGFGSMALHLRGGCPGASGGDAQNDEGGDGGLGGGAVHLVARDSIEINGALHAGGAGGTGGLRESGGGGGGAGGSLSVEAPVVAITAGALLAANGGGGGAGGDGGGDADSGQDGVLGTDAALGGAGQVDSGAGGQGGALEDINGERGTSALIGAGGGGGGVGRIRVYSAEPGRFQANATFSPGEVESLAIEQ